MAAESGEKPTAIVTEGEHAPEPSEAIHLPGPSYIPVIVALGVTGIVTGIVISWLLVVAGAIVTVIAVWRWIGDTRRDIGELPLEH